MRAAGEISVESWGGGSLLAKGCSAYVRAMRCLIRRSQIQTIILPGHRFLAVVLASLLGLLTALPAVAQWEGRDIGDVGMAGSDGDSGGVTTVRGSGADIWGSADAFHFRSREVTGDATFVAHIAEFDAANAWAKAGLMFREGMDPGAREVMALATPGHHVGLQYRSAPDGETTFIDGGWVSLPVWLMLDREGDTFRAFRSYDGETWTAAGSITLGLDSAADAGLAVTSHDNSALGTATYGDVMLMGGEAPPASDWESIEFGFQEPGSTTAGESSVTLTTSGEDIWNTVDWFRYYYRELHGDGEIVARVTDLAPTHPWAKAGVMIRGGLEDSSPNVAMLLTAGNVAVLQTRPEKAAQTKSVSGPWVHAPYWVRLVRTGDTFTGYVSPDGVDWTQVGTSTVALGEDVYVGLGASSHSEEKATASFDNIDVSGAAPGTYPPPPPGNASASVKSSTEIDLAWTDDATTETGYIVERSTDDTPFAVVATRPPDTTEYADMGLMPDTTYHYRLATQGSDANSDYTFVLTVHTLAGAESWMQQTWGGAALEGSVSGGSAYFNETGGDFWGTSDSGALVWQPLSGDGGISARIDQLSGANGWAKGGLTVRASLDAGAANAAVMVTPSNGVVFQVRAEDGGTSLLVQQYRYVAAPVRLRMARQGDTFSAFYSTDDGGSWESLGTATVSMPAAVHMGLAISSHDPSAAASAGFSEIEVE